MKLRRDPKVLQRFLDYLAKDVVRDEPVKKMILLTGLSAFSRDPINLFLKGPPSIGKSFNVTQTLRFFGVDVWWLGGLSPKALIHRYGTFIDSKTNEEVPNDWRETRLEELLKEHKLNKPKLNAQERDAKNKVKKQVDREYFEILKRGYYLVDLTDQILVFVDVPDPRTLQMLLPILSHDKMDLTFQFTDKTSKGILRTKEVRLRGWPATIFCTTESKYIEPLATRGFTITPEMSKEKYKEANVLFMQKKAFLRQPDKELPIFCEYIGEVKSFLRERNFEILTPFGPELAVAYPHSIPRDMRDIPHFSALIDMYTVFHVLQRPMVLVNGQPKAIIATLEDFVGAYNIFRGFVETTRMGLPGHILDTFHKVMLPLAEEYPEGFSYQDLVTKHNEVFSENYKSSKTLYTYVRELRDIGYVDTIVDPVNRRQKLIYVLKNPENILESLVGTLNNSFSLEQLKKWWNTQKKRSPQKKFTITFFDTEISLEELYEKCFSKTDFRENIFPSKERVETTSFEKEKEKTVLPNNQEDLEPSIPLKPLLQNFKPSVRELIEYARGMMAKRLPSKTTGDAFIFDLKWKGKLSDKEAKKLLDKLIDEGLVGYDKDGWLTRI